MADITPDMMKTMSGMKSSAEIVSFCESQGFEISEEGAARILDQFSKVVSLTEDDLDAVAGGWGVGEAGSS